MLSLRTDAGKCRTSVLLVALMVTMANIGYAGTSSISGQVYLDFDNNSSFNAGEGLVGVTVTLTYFGLDGAPGGGDDQTTATTTTTDGQYAFSNLASGLRSVRRRSWPGEGVIYSPNADRTYRTIGIR